MTLPPAAVSMGHHMHAMRASSESRTDFHIALKIPLITEAARHSFILSDLRALIPMYLYVLLNIRPGGPSARQVTSRLESRSAAGAPATSWYHDSGVNWVLPQRGAV